MKIVGEYNFAGGADIVKSKFADELSEIVACINSLDREKYKTKVSKEAVRKKGLLYSPVDLNKGCIRSHKKYPRQQKLLPGPILWLLLHQ